MVVLLPCSRARSSSRQVAGSIIQQQPSWPLTQSRFTWTALSTALESSGRFIKALTWLWYKQSPDITWATPKLWLWPLIPSSQCRGHQSHYINKDSRTKRFRWSNQGICYSFLWLPASPFRQQNVLCVSYARQTSIFNVPVKLHLEALNSCCSSYCKHRKSQRPTQELNMDVEHPSLVIGVERASFLI